MRVNVGNNVSVRYLVQVSWTIGFLLVSGVWDISSGIGPYFPLAGGLCKLYANAGGKLQINHQPLLVHYKQQANPLVGSLSGIFSPDRDDF
jgi:hypothetical protein